LDWVDSWKIVFQGTSYLLVQKHLVYCVQCVGLSSHTDKWTHRHDTDDSTRPTAKHMLRAETSENINKC